MSMVDHMGFKEFYLALQPLFKGISRNTIKSDIMKTYNEGKENIINFYQRIRVELQLLLICGLIVAKTEVT